MKTRPWISVSELDNPTHIDAEEAVQAASFILFSLSGQKYSGHFSVTEQYFCETTGAPVGCIRELAQTVGTTQAWVSTRTKASKAVELLKQLRERCSASTNDPSSRSQASL